MGRTKGSKAPKTVEALTHGDASRTYIPTAEYQSLVSEDVSSPTRVAYERRNRDLDPQLVWRGKDEQDWSDLVVQAPPLYIQEKVHPKALIDDLARHAAQREPQPGEQLNLFADFDGDLDEAASTEFYKHEANWSNRIILGDSLQVMASLAEREGLRGKVQCIYVDPPYGIAFNSNFQWSTTSRDVKDGNADHITREPEQVRAFRDTWRDGIHSYLTYLRDRLSVARDLLAESGSIFVQIGSENVHRVRAVLDEVFGADNAVVEIVVKKKGSQKSSLIDTVNDFILWYSRSKRSEGKTKFRSIFEERGLDAETIDEFSRLETTDGEIINLKGLLDEDGEELDFRAYPRRVEQEYPGGRLFRPWPITNGGARANQMDPVIFRGVPISPPRGRCWSHRSRSDTNALSGMDRIRFANRLIRSRSALDYVRYLGDFGFKTVSNWWDGFGGAQGQVYVVQTNERIIERCVLMTTDPGDLVLDPTCGSGTSAFVAEKWGRRWITIDTSRVALALSRARIMGARYPYYILSDSPEGLRKEAEVSGHAWVDKPTYRDVRQGFVYRRVPYIESGVIANNAEIDVIHETWQPKVQGALDRLNAALRGHAKPYPVTTGGREGMEVRFDAGPSATFTMPSGEVVAANALVEWEVPRETPADWPSAAGAPLRDFWTARMGRQNEIDASIAAKADTEYLYDRPYEDKGTVRVAGPFTVESLSPHRVIAVNWDDTLIDGEPGERPAESERGFVRMILENLKAAGVQQAHREDRIVFSSLAPWPGRLICAEGRYDEGAGAGQKRAAIFIGPEFGTVTRPDLVEAAREAGDAGFDVLITCAFNYDAHSTEFSKLGRIPVLKARMNADLHMGGELKPTGKGNLFVIFGEPDIDILDVGDGTICVKVNGIDIFKPQEGKVEKSEPDELACWFIDTDYNEESFFVRHAYFLGAGDPYQSLKISLRAEIDEHAWATLYSDTSRPFPKPASGRIAVKVINHLGDEVMKVFKVT